MKCLHVDHEASQLIQAILNAHLLQPATVWAFGSRTTNKAKQYSDLDLAIDSAKPLSLVTMAALASAFEDSLLPYKVDLVDWSQLSDSFKARILRDRLLFWTRAV